jgi:hypothetical protein
MLAARPSTSLRARLKACPDTSKITSKSPIVTTDIPVRLWPQKTQSKSEFFCSHLGGGRTQLLPINLQAISGQKQFADNWISLT